MLQVDPEFSFRVDKKERIIISCFANCYLSSPLGSSSALRSITAHPRPNNVIYVATLQSIYLYIITLSEFRQYSQCYYETINNELFCEGHFCLVRFELNSSLR